MEFESANPTIIKSIKQRDLLNTWLRLYARKQLLPRVGEYQPSRIEEELPDLVFYIVESTQPLRSDYRERRHADVDRLRL